MKPRFHIVNEREFEAALRRMVNEVEDRSKDGVKEGTDAIEAEFARRAKKLTGAYSRSFVSESRKGSDGWESGFGPDVPYAGKQERANHTLAESMRAAERKAIDALEDVWRRATN